MKKVLPFILLLCLVACAAPKPVSDAPGPDIAEAYRFPELHFSAAQDLPSWMYVGEPVDMRAFSHPDAPVVRATNERHLVQVLCTAGMADEFWALIVDPWQDSMENAVGWVPIDALEAYTSPETQPLIYPVRLREGATDLNTGEAVRYRGSSKSDPIFPRDNLTCAENDGQTATVTWEGGNSARVSSADVVYPTIDGDTLVFDTEK